MSKEVSVLFAPWAKLNPYQHLLVRNLKQSGVIVENLHGEKTLLDTLVAPKSPLPDPLPDIVHLHWIHPFIRPDRILEPFVLGPRLLRRVEQLKEAGVKVVWTVHNLRSHESLVPWLETRWLSRLAKTVDALIVHCRSAARLVEAEYHLASDRRLFVVPHANYIGCYPDGIDPRSARREFGFDEDHRVLLFFGQLRRYKGLFDLVRSFRSVKDPRARLLVAGRPKGDVEAELVRRIGADDRIVLRPEFVPDEKVQFLMGASDVVVLPFRNVLTSGSAILSMSFQRPVVAPRIGCIPDLLAGQKDLLYGPREPNGLGKVLDRVISYPGEDLRALGVRNHERIKDLSWKRMASQTADVYKRVLME